jgi:hypothetical protein
MPILDGPKQRRRAKDAVSSSLSPDIVAIEKEELAALDARNAAHVAATREAILKDALTADAVAAFLSRTRYVIDRLRQSGALLAIKDGRFFRFPRWQFDETSKDGLLPGFERALKIMDASVLRKAAWFIRPNIHFKNRTPIEALRAGEVERVCQEAKTVASA